MNDAVVLGGDRSFVEHIDGDSDLIIDLGATCSLITGTDVDEELLSILSGELSLEHEHDGELGIITTMHEGAYPAYTGPSIVVPKIAQEQVLETKDKTLFKNIEVTKIPIYETTNPSGGTTVYIGGDIAYG